MLYYGDEVGYINDYSYRDDPSRNYDNRWMHRPVIDWDKNERRHKQGTTEQRIFSGIHKLIKIRSKVAAVGDYKNLVWLATNNKHVAGYLRTREAQRLYCLFNFSDQPVSLSWQLFKEHGSDPKKLWEHWREIEYVVDEMTLRLDGYQFVILETEI